MLICISNISYYFDKFSSFISESKWEPSWVCWGVFGFLLPRMSFLEYHAMKNHPLSFEIENNTTINRRMKFRSKVWAHFLMNRNDGKAKCVHCSKVLKAKGGSTKSLHHHLIFKLSTVVPKLNKNILYRKMTSVHEGKNLKSLTYVNCVGKYMLIQETWINWIYVRRHCINSWR